MCLDIVNVGLLQISQVAEAHFGISYRQVDGKHLSQRRLIVQGGKFYYSTRISQREYLVIRLSVVGREHHSHMVTILCRTEQENTLSVPTGAILQKEGKAYVFVFHPSSNTVHRQEVSILRLLNNGHSLITSRQLQPGEQIVSSGVHHIEDGEIVKPLSPVTNTNIGGLL